MRQPLPETEKLSPSAQWIQYWNQDPFWAETKIWTINAKLFSKHAAPWLNLKKTDRILDFGSGSGETALCLAPEVAFYKGVDNSALLLEKAKERCVSSKNITFEVVSNINLGDSEHYSLFLAVSVIQYFESMEQIIELVQEFRSRALPKARILLADIPQPRGLGARLWDLMSSIFQAAKEGYLIEYLKILCRIPFSFYKKFSHENPILEIPIDELDSKISKLGFKTQIIRQSLSICANRPSLLIQL